MGDPQQAGPEISCYRCGQPMNAHGVGNLYIGNQGSSWLAIAHEMFGYNSSAVNEMYVGLRQEEQTMSTRREVSGKYRMEVTAKEDCSACFGTGIAMEQSAHPNLCRIEVLLSVCMCVRVLPRLAHDPNARADPFSAEETLP